MQLEAGTRLGPYEIVAPIGAGGMGEVYRARDERLHRTVAIKILRHLSDRPDLRQRFEREARAISSLSHAHICAVFDVGEIDDVAFLVMEYLEGETLTDRLARGPLPLQQVLRFGSEIAAALDAAHRQQLVHRDLKPGNIMLTRSGVKLLDFGLAKLTNPRATSLFSGDSATQHKSLTAEGTIVGTLQYMAPEQLEGKEVDARTDIFALGTVLYEMVTGRHAFHGDSQASLIAAILHSDPPPLAALQPVSPPALERIVRPCLAKDPDERWQTARDIALQLKGLSESSSNDSIAAGTIGRTRRPWLTPLLAGVVAGAILAAIALILIRPKNPATASTRLSVLLPDGQSLDTEARGALPMAISPDGTKLVYGATSPSGSRLYLRKLASAEATPLAGTEGASGPFFSPDGNSVGFFMLGGHLKICSLTTGNVSELGESGGPGRGATWLHDGTIIFAGVPGGGLERMPAGGGKREPMTVVAPGEAGHALPQALPGERYVIFTTEIDGKSFDEARIELLDLKTKARKRLFDGGTSARYVAPGRLLFARGGRLFSVAFDLQTQAVTGDPSEVAQPVLVYPDSGCALFDVARNGMLILVPYSSAMFNTRLEWVDRAGKPTPIPLEPRLYKFPRVSPNGKKLLVEVGGANDDLWVDDLARGTFSRLTFNLENMAPIWNADSSSVIFARYGSNLPDIFMTPADRTAEPQKLIDRERPIFPMSVSADGRWLAFSEVDKKTGWDIFVVALPGASTPRRVVGSTFNETSPDFSPDGKWIVYTSDESGVPEVYVQPFQGAGEKTQVSTDGGIEPMWSHGGREIFYRSGDRLMVVDATPEKIFSAGKPRVLFERHFEPAFLGRNYDVTPDDQRFVIVERDPAQERNIRRIDVIVGQK